jgi:hypothetical protein
MSTGAPGMMVSTSTAGVTRRWAPGVAAVIVALASGYFWGERASARAKLRPPSSAELAQRAADEAPRELALQRPRVPAAPGVAPALSAATDDTPLPPADDSDTEPTLTAEEERQQHITKLRESGRDQRNLLGTVLTSFGDWHQKLAEAKLDVKLGSWSCFRGGCFMEAVHPSAASVSNATAIITTTDSFLRWNSSKMRSGEITRPDGTIEVTWMIFAPPESEAVLQPPRTTQ